jgi:hypothetical protein
MNTTQIAEAYQGLDQKEREQKFTQLLAKVEKSRELEEPLNRISG